MTWWLDVLAVATLVILAFVALAHSHHIWMMIRHNEKGVAGGSVGDQMLGRPDDPVVVEAKHP